MNQYRILWLPIIIIGAFVSFFWKQIPSFKDSRNIPPAHEEILTQVEDGVVIINLPYNGRLIRQVDMKGRHELNLGWGDTSNKLEPMKLNYVDGMILAESHHCPVGVYVDQRDPNYPIIGVALYNKNKKVIPIRYYPQMIRFGPGAMVRIEFDGRACFIARVNINPPEIRAGLPDSY